MAANFSIVPVLYLLGIAHGLFLVVALLSKNSGPRLANLYLGLYTLVFVSALFDYFLDVTGLIDQYVAMRTILWPKEFLYGVLIYFYTRELTHPGEYSLRGQQWWHFSPAFLHILVTWPLLLISSQTQIRVLTNQPNASMQEQIWSLILGDIELVLVVIHITIYLLMSMRLIQQYQRGILAQFSNIEPITLAWLRNLLIGTLAVYACWLVDEFVDFGTAVEGWADAILGISMVVLIYSMSFLGLRQPQVFSNRDLSSASTMTNNESIDESVENEKYRYSALSPEMSANLYTELTNKMVDNKLYANNDLSLPKLAEEIGVSVNYLSQVINQQSGQNFFDFINRYRVEEVQKHIQNKPEITMLDLALDAGFNSKSAFYAAFRKYTGLTPSQYKKSLSV